MPVRPLPGPAPLCECGCGLPVKSSKNGVWSRWRSGHQYQRNVTGNSLDNLERKRRRALR